MDNSSQSQLVNVIVEHDYTAADEDELNLCRGDTIRCVERRPGGWWWGELRGRAGLFPDNFVKVIGSVHDVLNGVVLRNPNPNPQYCRAMFSYQPANHDELSLSVGDIIQVLGEVEEGWWKGQRDNQQGVFPSNFVVPLEPVVQPPPVLPPKAVREQCKVLFPYTAANGDELTLAEGDIVTILTRDVPDQGWWRGELRGRAGLFPDNFVTVLPTMSHGTNSTAEPVDKKPVRPVKILSSKNQPVSMNRKDSTSSKSSIGSQENVAAVRKSLELTDHTGQKSRRSGSSQPGDNNSAERLRKSVENDAISKQKPRRSLEVEGSGKPPVPAKKASSPVGSVFSSIRQKMLGGDQRSSERNSSLDVSDGASSSKPSGEPSLLSVSPSATSMGRPPSSMDSDVIPPADGFDQVERFSMLADPRIGRAKPPGRRPPTQAPRDDIPLTNGSSHPPVPSEIPVETEAVKPKAREWEKHKAPWMDELKLNQAKKTSPIAEIGRSKTIPATDNASGEKTDSSHSRLSGSNDKILESSAAESDKDSPPLNPIEMSQSMTSISSKTIKIETSEEVQARTENPLDMSKSMSSLASRTTHLETNNKVSSSELRTSISSSASVVLRSTTVPQHGNAVAPPASINNSTNNPGSPLPNKHQSHPVPVVRPTSNSAIMPQFTPLSRHSTTALVDHGLIAMKHEPNEHNFVKPPTADSCARTIKFTDEVSAVINTPDQLLIAQLNERVANLERVVEAQEERFSSALAVLGSRLEKEIELRAALQAELHKLERCVTRV